MPFEIVRNDIVNMQADAIVNTANPKPIIGYGVDMGIHKKAGPKLLDAREGIGDIDVGGAIITEGFCLDAKFVIHTVGPVWQGGQSGEEELLKRCYEKSLELAVENKCESIAFPLLSAGNHGFPKPLALQIAIGVFSEFLMNHEMQIYLVVFGKDTFSLSEKLFNSVQSYIDEKYIVDKTLDEYGVKNKKGVREDELEQICQILDARRNYYPEPKYQEYADFSMPCAPMPCGAPCDLEKLLDDTDAGFSETLLKLIDRTGKKDSDIYKKANVDRKLFSKIRNNPDYKPSKATAIAFAIALELSLDETRDFIARAGFALSHSSKFDIIIEYFISNGNYDMFEINETLFAFDQNLLGA